MQDQVSYSLSFVRASTESKVCLKQLKDTVEAICWLRHDKASSVALN